MLVPQNPRLFTSAEYCKTCSILNYQRINKLHDAGCTTQPQNQFELKLHKTTSEVAYR